MSKKMPPAPVELQPVPLGPPPAYSAQHPVAGPSTAPAPGATGVYVQQQVVEFQFPEHPVGLVCKHCGKSIVTVVDSECLWGRFFTCLFCFAFLIIIGCCAMSSNNCQCRGTKHSCPECKKSLGMAK